MKGNGYLGSPDLMTSQALQELVPTSPDGWSYKYNLYKFSFINKQDCHVIINNGAQLYIPANLGFEIEVGDAPIQSFVIVEPNIQYYWIGSY